jgi:hypothetical protein
MTGRRSGYEEAEAGYGQCIAHAIHGWWMVRPHSCHCLYVIRGNRRVRAAEVARTRCVHPQAADIVRVLGVGRNEYIAILNACKVGRDANVERALEACC